jgi:hypothetical protein
MKMILVSSLISDLLHWLSCPHPWLWLELDLESQLGRGWDEGDIPGHGGLTLSGGMEVPVWWRAPCTQHTMFGNTSLHLPVLLPREGCFLWASWCVAAEDDSIYHSSSNLCPLFSVQSLVILPEGAVSRLQWVIPSTTSRPSPSSLEVAFVTPSLLSGLFHPHLTSAKDS